MGENDTENLKLNFPDDTNEVYRKTKHSKYFGVSYNATLKLWIAQRWSKTEKKIYSNGYYKNEETAAHASDTLGMELMLNCGKNLKLNFPDKAELRPELEEHPASERKRSFDLDHSQSDENLEK